MEKPIQLSLIAHEIETEIVNQRISDGYVNATAMCKLAGKAFAHYMESASTKAFVEELSADVDIPISGLIHSIKGGVPQYQGSWVHPRVALHLAQWLSPKFAVLVSKWILEWMTGGNTQTLPYHLKRYMANREQIPHTHFSILNEMTFGLIASLESQGYILPENLIPDISEGRMFATWLATKGVDSKRFQRYQHKYEDGRVVEARLYPNSLLAEFRQHFHEIWLPQRAESYFEERDNKAVPFIKNLVLMIENNDKKKLN